MSIFEQATKQRLRFTTTKGEVSVEDLWAMPLQHPSRFSLDDVAKQINKQLKDSAEESFVSQRTSGDKVLSLRMDIVKHIIAVKLEEQAIAKKAAANRAQKEFIAEIINEKQNSEMKSKSLDELQLIYDNL